MKLEECINYLLTIAQRGVSQMMTQRLAPFDITPSQYGVLNCLWLSEGPLLPREIAEMLSLETSTVSGILDRMQKKELIDRMINENNRREIFVSLTEKGAALEEDVVRTVEELNAEVLESFGAEEAALFKNQLREIAAKTL